MRWQPPVNEPWMYVTHYIPLDGVVHEIEPTCPCRPQMTPGEVIHVPQWAHFVNGPRDGDILPKPPDGSWPPVITGNLAGVDYRYDLTHKDGRVVYVWNNPWKEGAPVR